MTATQDVQVACVVIASVPRAVLLAERVLPSVLGAGFDEVVVAGLYQPGPGYRYLHIPPLTETTVDALVKRDAGTLATEAEIVVYLCDDHAWMNGVGVIKAMTQSSDVSWDALVPRRWSDHPERGRIRINNGESDGYCGGHAGVFRRSTIRHTPWSAMPHDRLWDLHASRLQQRAGFRFLSVDGIDVLDLEPERQPWR